MKESVVQPYKSIIPKNKRQVCMCNNNHLNCRLALEGKDDGMAIIADIKAFLDYIKKKVCLYFTFDDIDSTLCCLGAFVNNNETLGTRHKKQIIQHRRLRPNWFLELSILIFCSMILMDPKENMICFHTPIGGFLTESLEKIQTTLENILDGKNLRSSKRV